MELAATMKSLTLISSLSLIAYRHNVRVTLKPRTCPGLPLPRSSKNQRYTGLAYSKEVSCKDVKLTLHEEEVLFIRLHDVGL